MAEVTFTLDTLTGTLLVEETPLSHHVCDQLTDLVGAATEIGCARPAVVLPPPAVPPQDAQSAPCLRVSGYYHNSLIEGPGRRSSLLVAGCDRGCPGCWVPFLHPTNAGVSVPVDRLADALLDPAYERDGISILGGEPMQQGDSLRALVRALRARACPHILVYSGYTYEQLQRLARRQPAIDAVLHEIDMLLDGPYVQHLAGGAGPWTGSRNQRVLVLRAGTPTGALSRNPSP